VVVGVLKARVEELRITLLHNDDMNRDPESPMFYGPDIWFWVQRSLTRSRVHS